MTGGIGKCQDVNIGQEVTRTKREGLNIKKAGLYIGIKWGETLKVCRNVHSTITHHGRKHNYSLYCCRFFIFT